MWRPRYVSYLLIFFSLRALAEDGVPFPLDQQIPTGTVLTQLANLAILIGAIVFTQRKTIAKAFADKKENFLKSVQESSKSKREAQDVLHEVTTRLNAIKQTFGSQVEKAKADSEDSYRAQLADAKNEAVRIKTSAQANLEFEVQRQIEQLRIETFKKSADKAEKDLGKKLTPEQLKAWNNHFVSNAEGVH